MLAKVEETWKKASEAKNVSYLVRRLNGFGILLVDEVEKVHPKVMQSLLGVLDDGVAHLSNGNEVDMSNILVLMTSNLGEAEKRDAR